MSEEKKDPPLGFDWKNDLKNFEFDSGYEIKSAPGLHGTLASMTTVADEPSTPPPKEWWNIQDAMTISAAVLIFAAVVLAVFTYFFKDANNKEKIVDSFIVILVVLMSVFLIVAGYDKEQLTPLIGLFGTIIGYILGRKSNEPDTKKGSGQ